MSADTDQADRVLLAERVMGWTETESSKRHPRPELRSYSPRGGGFFRTVNEGNWNPFANAAEAIEVMGALRARFGIGMEINYFAVDLMGFRGYDGYRVIPCGFAGWGSMTYTEGPDFARTLTTAIVRLVRERPELFGGAK